MPLSIHLKKQYGFDIRVDDNGWFTAENKDGMRYSAQTLRTLRRKIAGSYADKRIPKLLVVLVNRTFGGSPRVGRLTGNRRVMSHNEKIQYEVKTSSKHTDWKNEIYLHPGKVEMARIKRLKKAANEASRKYQDAIDKLVKFDVREVD